MSVQFKFNVTFEWQLLIYFGNYILCVYLTLQFLDLYILHIQISIYIERDTDICIYSCIYIYIYGKEHKVAYLFLIKNIYQLNIY